MRCDNFLRSVAGDAAAKSSHDGPSQLSGESFRIKTPRSPGTARRMLLYASISALIAAASFGLSHLVFSLQAARASAAEMVPSPVDIGFAQSMSVHHQQAIWMSQFLLDGRPTQLTALAQTIAYSQLEELGEMQGWLRLWKRPLLPAAPSMDWMLLGAEAPDEALTQYLLDCRHSPTGMLGLASNDQVNRLRQLSGVDRDREFLSLMLAHHEGALPMAQFAVDHASLPAVRELAGRVVLAQAEEIHRIRLMLLALQSPS
jgi:uncharacterized protein (DUF305 family)